MIIEFRELLQWTESVKRKQKLQQLAADIAIAHGQNDGVTLLALCSTMQVIWWCVYDIGPLRSC